MLMSPGYARVYFRTCLDDVSITNTATSDSMFITAFYQFSQYLAQLTTPLSMFVIGMIIYRTGFKSLRMNRETFGVLVGRYLVSPIVVWLLALAIPIPSLMLKVFIVQSAMPRSKFYANFSSTVWCRCQIHHDDASIHILNLPSCDSYFNLFSEIS